MQVSTTPIPGLLKIDLDVHGDHRGWFKENWQREKMVAAGLPDFGPVQSNVALSHRGVTRGIHAEPWDKFVSVANGRVFGAWVDLREGESFGATFHVELDADTAIFVPRGVGNAYQALEDDTAYAYLVNDHWRPDATYAALDLSDATAAIPWPIPLDEADVSEKDQRNPRLADVDPIQPKPILILGSHGQLGRALQQVFPTARAIDHHELDLTDHAAVEAWPWRDFGTIINAAAYTAVDTAETTEGRRTAWALNAQAPALLARVARDHGLTLVHVSTDYVFDGTHETHDEDEPFSPLGVYAQSKAAGDLAVATAPRHYILRTSWLVGEGNNFVRTMARLAANGVCPSVVDDQYGRLTFTEDLARAIEHLLRTNAAHGTYNLTSDGPVVTWADIARDVFRHLGREPGDVSPVTTDEYADGKTLAPRPVHSGLNLAKIRAAGFQPEDGAKALAGYLTSQ